MTQPHQDAIQVPQARANEIFQGKAATSIKDLMVEVAQLSAVAEQLGKELHTERAAHRETKAKLAQAMSAQQGISGPPPDASPQDPSS